MQLFYFNPLACLQQITKQQPNNNSNSRQLFNSLLLIFLEGLKSVDFNSDALLMQIKEIATGRFRKD